MKKILFLSCLLLCSCGSTDVIRTTHPDGTVTEVPALSPRDAAWEEKSKLVLERKFN